MSTVLVVEPDAGIRARLSDGLERAGYAVLECPGPSAPDYTCVGSRDGFCPLAESATTVVLDLSLAGDRAMQGVPGWEMLFFYYERGKRIVVLSSPRDPLVPLPDDRIAVLPRGSDAGAVAASVRALSIGSDTDGHDPAR